MSGVCEDTTDAPILGMQRFLTDRPADEKMRQIRRFFAEINLRYRAIYVSPDPPAAAFTSHAGERGPIADTSTLRTIAAEIRPGSR